MDFYRPGSLAEALAVKAETPEAVPIAGGTDVMVELNFDKRRPPALLDLGRVAELARVGGGERPRAARRGACPTRASSPSSPGCCRGSRWRSRTVGSPQIRNRGTVGGNLGSASPAGDAHPPLIAVPSVVEVASTRGTRTVPIGEFFHGPKKSALEPDELITAVLVPKAAGPQQFAKVGTRNAMVIAVCSFAALARPGGAAGRHGDRLGGADAAAGRRRGGLRGRGAALGRAATVTDEVAREFGELVAAAARPIDDVRGSAAYRRHALAVLARRTLRWAWQDRGRWT